MAEKWIYYEYGDVLYARAKSRIGDGLEAFKQGAWKRDYRFTNCGSEIQNPEEEARTNPDFAKAYAAANIIDRIHAASEKAISHV